MQTVDAMGKACPTPVIMTRKALRDNDVVVTRVSEKIATENISKMAKQLGYKVSVEQKGDHEWAVTVEKQATMPTACDAAINATTVEDSGDQQRIEPATFNSIRLSDGYIVVLDSNEVGRGDSTLGKQLAKSFVSSLTEQDVLPEYILMFNSGVKLAMKDADTVEDLQALEKMGVKVMECGICVNFFDIKDQLGVGSITNMFRITELMRTAQRVVKPC
ncbi:sulfurtransferase-like selenium metabolism protein YedF [Limosilactobacillus sp.]|jgi:selenium metabolism protein YedF|uniref:sulfurtransferase-like selenium metabolism protein YedF n=1 Tax=Limosilactobacillus sp. TaxID=2773925 RepID=UPI0035A0AEBC